jgi:hypothetical protein
MRMGGRRHCPGRKEPVEVAQRRHLKVRGQRAVIEFAHSPDHLVRVRIGLLGV